MAEVDGKTVMKAPDGRLFRVPPDQVEKVSRDLSWKPASDDEAAKRQAEREQYAKFGSTGQQAIAAGETALRSATFGAIPGGENWRDRDQVLRQESPVISMGAQAVGTLAPALAAGALTGGAGAALGLGTRAAGLAAGAAEGIVGGAADEVEQARAETRDVSAGNIFLYGLGGEIVGRALPHALSRGAGKVRRALTAVEAATGEGVPSALAHAEARSVESQARLARDLPPGSPERAAALRDSAAHHYERMATESADDLGKLTETTARMGETNAKRVTERLRETMADPSPAQTEFFTEARKRLDGAKAEARAPMAVEGPAPTTMDEFLAGVTGKKAKSKAFDEVTDEVTARAQKLGLDPATAAQSAEWDAIQREVLAEKAAGRTTPLSSAPGMAPIAKEFDAVIDKGLRRLDKTTDTAEQYLAAREVKQQLQRLSDKVGRLADKYPAAEQMKATVDGAWQHVADGLTDKSLFGAAADIEREISSPFRDKIAQSLGTVEQDLARGVGDTAREFDPKKVRAFLKGDKVDRAVTQNHLERVLEGAEEQLAAHERHGTWDAGEIAKTRERIGRIRESIGLADEIHVAKQEAIPSAKSGKAAGEPAPPKPERDGMAGELAEFALEKIVGGAIPFAGQFIKLGKRILGMDGAARAATKQVARNLAGVGAGYAERALGGAARGVAGGAAAVGTMTALQRFTGDYSGPEESWEAKKKLLDDEQVSPDVLYEVLGNTLGDLPKVNPELFQQIAARTAGKIRYLRENLPPGLQVSLLYPNGTPPSQSALREWATQWNTVMDPETVLHDIDNGTATPLQMKTLKESDRDLYEQLRGDCIEQVGTHFESVPTSTKLQLDLLFDADGLAGPMFSSHAADMVGEAMAAAAERAPGATQPSAPGGAGLGSNSGSNAPSGLDAIKTSVTNRGTGA